MRVTDVTTALMEMIKLLTLGSKMRFDGNLVDNGSTWWKPDLPMRRPSVV